MPQAKLHRCVDKVKKGGDVDNPFAVCNASIGEAFMANDNYPNMKQEGGVGSGKKGHTTAKDLPFGQDPQGQGNIPSPFRVSKADAMVDDIRKIGGQTTVEDWASKTGEDPAQLQGQMDKMVSDGKLYARGDEMMGTIYSVKPFEDYEEGGQGSGPKKNGSSEPYSSWKGAPKGKSVGQMMDERYGKITEKPLTMTEASRLIQEMQATPMTGSTKRMSGGSKGKAPKHWTPVDFNVLDKAQGQKPVPPPVGRALKEANICEVCGIKEMNHGIQDHPMIPPMPQENHMPPMPNGFPPTEPSPQVPMPQPQEQQPFPQPNGMPPMPPAQVPQPMPNSPQEQDDFPPQSEPPFPPMPQEQIPPIPTENPEPQMQMQYTVSVPNSLSAQSIGGKKINEMIREIEHYIRK